MLYVIAGMNEFYSANLATEVLKGLKENAYSCRHTGGTPPLGYDVDAEGHLVINEREAEAVRMIYTLYLDGQGYTAIISALNKGGYLTKRGQPFGKNSLYEILKNEKYTGIYKHDNEIITNMYPQLIDNETFEKVRSKSRVNHYGKRSVKTIYLLRNKLKCGYCGMPISAECGTASNGEKKHYYKCLGRKRHNGCEKQNIRKDLLESLVIDSIISKLSKPKILDTIISNLLKIQDEQIKESSILTSLYKEKAKYETMLNNVMSAIEQGIINNTTNKRMKDLESTIEELDKQTLIEKSKTRIKLSREDIQEFYKEALKLESKMLINYIVKEIIVYDDKLQIQFNSPLRTSPTDTTCSFFTEHKKIPCKYLNDFTFRTQDIEIILAI
jgi:site-specific DNA recombinase